MKLRIFISLLFVIATSFSAVHELEHISGEHSASTTCSVCIIDDHLVSADISNDADDFELRSTKKIKSTTKIFSLHIKKSDNHSNAPPTFS